MRCDSAPDVGAWLASGAAFPHRPAVRRIDTHAASIFLEGDRAWKLKRPVRFGFLDFSTVDRRRVALEAELRLNRRTAPGIYRAIHPIRRDGTGRLAIDGAGVTVDWVLEMHRFPDDALLEAQLEHGQVGVADLRSLADRLVLFHAAASGAAASPDGAARIAHVVDGNARSMAQYPGILPPAEAQALTALHRAEVERHRLLLQARGATGRVRHCHGDLHLANIAMLDGILTPFDCLEFDDRLATVDVLYDLAFLLMDLWRANHREAANILANRYLDRSPEDEEGMALLPLFMSIRAVIRAHVEAAEAKRTGGADAAAAARRYLALARVLLIASPPRVIAVGGLSGSGKTTVSRMLAPAVGRPPGARHLRSDVLRKRMAGVAPEVPLDAAAYAPEASERVYAELFRLAGVALRAGQSAIADAVFGTHGQKAAIAAVAVANGSAFAGIWLDLPEGQRLKRVEERGPDASDADAGIVRQQTRAPDAGPGDWISVPAVGTPEELLAAVKARLPRSGVSDVPPLPDS